MVSIPFFSIQFNTNIQFIVPTLLIVGALYIIDIRLERFYNISYEEMLYE